MAEPGSLISHRGGGYYDVEGYSAPVRGKVAALALAVRVKVAAPPETTDGASALARETVVRAQDVAPGAWACPYCRTRYQGSRDIAIANHLRRVHFRETGQSQHRAG